MVCIPTEDVFMQKLNDILSQAKLSIKKILS